MKVGDKVPVTIAGQVVAQASIKETGDGTATLVVPATLVVMATRTELAVETPPEDTTGTETVITGVERTSGEPVESAVVGEPQPISDNSTDTSGGDNAQAQVDGEAGTNDTSSANTSEVVSPENVQAETQDVPAAAEVASNSTGVAESSPEVTSE